MDLLTYIKAKRGRGSELARALQTHPAYIWQIAHRWRGHTPSRRLARDIVQATGGAVSYAELRPGDSTEP